MILLLQTPSCFLLGKCFLNALFLSLVWKIRWCLVPPRHPKAVFVVQGVFCNLEVVELLLLCCPSTSH